MAETKNLAGFCDYVAQQASAIRAIYTEIEEVQQQFNEIYRQKLAAWQAALGRAVPLLLGEPALPPPMAQKLLAVVDQERARLEKEIADLTAQVGQKRAEADQALGAAQTELANLRQLNPQLDAQEEELKARLATLRQTIAQIEAQIRATGFLTGILARRRLGREREALRSSLAEATARLREVRQRWGEEKKRVQADQARLHEAWDRASVEASQLQSRLDYLQGNLERLSRQNGAARFAGELESVPEVPAPLQPALAEMVELNGVKAAYEEGLRTVAEALGLLKGLAEGLDRFYKSAEKVLDEQRTYKLRDLRLALSDEVLRFHALWPEFRAQVKDEKALGTHPAEFSQRVQAIIKDRLGDSAIAAMFESMGAALTQATKAWG